MKPFLAANGVSSEAAEIVNSAGGEAVSSLEW